MIRGTTPILEFMLPFDAGALAEAYITMMQDRRVVLEKRLSDCVCEGNYLRLRLAQADTLKLSHIHDVEIQIRARTFAGDAIASNIIKADAERILKDGVI